MRAIIPSLKISTPSAVLRFDCVVGRRPNTSPLYNWETIKHLWVTFSNCLNLNITMKHVILGLNNDDYISINNHLCITIVSYSIYKVWSISSFERKRRTLFDVKFEIHKNLLFYRDVFKLIFSKQQFSNLEQKFNCMLFHLPLK